MAITNGYTTAALLKARLGIDDTDDDTAIDAAVNAASRAIDTYCRRRFYLDGSTSARTFYGLREPRSGRTFVRVDDFDRSTSPTVKTDSGDNGTFDVTWASTDYEMHPLNGVSDGRENWPCTHLVAVADRDFPTGGDRARVEITADWGWSAVPDEVAEACLIKAARLFRRKDTPEGIAGGFEFGAVRITRFEDPDVELLLGDLRRTVYEATRR